MVYNLHSPWRKSAIMPIWSFQLILLSVDLIIAALLVCITNNTPAQTVSIGGKNVTIEAGTQSWDVANLVLAAIALLLTCAEIVLYVYSDLSPAIFLGSSALKAGTWTVVLVLDILAVSSNWEKGQWNNYIIYVVVGFAGAVYLILIVGVIYAVVVFLRQRGTVASNVEKYMMTTSDASFRNGY
ncbi:uncharacterized protein LY89DRAFT_359004 [Mollisia scopiformis]|uniref:Uncharacterized protein n=1 Tax=Mollisia scopiformis TaxID=149040 RepID=A0A132B5I4_MOLSC|nr:uncharacterized protein LY89DRAFT_359004 [Mollisia scopiformis]KUJ07601.1 hypothetical protein LY89DRAFT_359004 [Mollisia scopiformis]